MVDAVVDAVAGPTAASEASAMTAQAKRVTRSEFFILNPSRFRTPRY